MRQCGGFEIQVLCLAIVALFKPIVAGELPPGGETHAFKIHGYVTYRCYAGYGPVKQVDSRTQVPCDNQTRKKVLIDERIVVRIREEPNPEDSRDLSGGMQRDVRWEGRTFTASLTLFKSVDAPAATPYRLCITACDDEPVHRHTAVIADARQVGDFNRLTVTCTSVGQPEEIEFNVSVEPVKM
jgi:hypothetical protein